MSLSVVGLQDFRKFFQGNRSSYGVHVYANIPQSGEKEEGNSFTKKEPLEDQFYKAHLEGDVGLGIVPIDEKNKCRFAVIDVDDYSDTKHIIELIYTQRLPLVPFRSKSGGLHLYSFFRSPVAAAKVIEFMRSFTALLSLDSKTEVFPKQSRLLEGQAGNWINLPYYHAEETRQYIIDVELKAMPFDEAMSYISENLIAESEMEGVSAELPMQDAPPCLQAIYIAGTTECRNAYLFSLARYFKTKHGDDFESYVLDANNALDNPLPTEEVLKSIISSHQKRDYTYKCKDEPIVSICNRTECLKRRYGIGGDEVSELDYGILTQFRTDPPYYEWEVNEIPLRFYDEADLTTQQRFRNLCLRELHKYPAKLKDSIFTGILNNALVNLVVESMGESDDLSPGAFLRHYLHAYLTKRAAAQHKGQLKMGKVYSDEKKKAFVFVSIEFFKFLQMQGFNHFRPTEVYQRLREMGGESITYNLGKQDGRLRVWAIPFDSIKKLGTSITDEDLRINFGDEHEREPF